MDSKVKAPSMAGKSTLRKQGMLMAMAMALRGCGAQVVHRMGITRELHPHAVDGMRRAEIRFRSTRPHLRFDPKTGACLYPARKCPGHHPAAGKSAARSRVGCYPYAAGRRLLKQKRKVEKALRRERYKAECALAKQTGVWACHAK